MLFSDVSAKRIKNERAVLAVASSSEVMLNVSWLTEGEINELSIPFLYKCITFELNIDVIIFRMYLQKTILNRQPR
jgi:hypothetical protein